MLRHVRVHSRRGKTQNLRSTKDATEATYSYNKRRRHFPVLVSSNTLGTEVRSHRCLVGALGGILCVRQHQCDHVATAKQTRVRKLRRIFFFQTTVSPSLNPVRYGAVKFLNAGAYSVAKTRGCAFAR